MDITLVLTQTMGIVFTVLGLSILINKKMVNALVEELTHNMGLLWLCGLMVTTLGALLIALNSAMWSSGLQMLIVIVGWLSLLKGILILVFPNATVSLYKKSASSGLIMFSGVVALVLGLIILYAGFMY